MKRLPLLACVLFTLPLCAQPKAQPPAKMKQVLPTGTRDDRDLEYGPHGERNTLDLFRPQGTGPFPLVVWIHGGAWQNGNKSGANPAIRLLERGYAVASINYRLSGQAIFPAQIHDCKAAIRYLRANAKKYDLDGAHIGVWGSSAGGHLVALLGTSTHVKELEGDGRNLEVSSRVQAVIDWFGPTDLLKMNEQATIKGPIDHNAASSPESKLIGGAIQDNKEKAERANPLKYISKDTAPFLIFHGDKDPLVPVGQSTLLHEALKKAGIESALHVIPGAAHGPGIGSPDTFEKINRFLDQHLKPVPKKP